MTVAIKAEGRGVMAIDITGTTSAANAGQGQVANPEGVNVIILRSTLLTKTASTGAANLGIGVAASGAKVMMARSVEVAKPEEQALLEALNRSVITLQKAA